MSLDAAPLCPSLASRNPDRLFPRGAHDMRIWNSARKTRKILWLNAGSG
jgi:hypothetical protein